MTIGYFVEKKFGKPAAIEKLQEYGFVPGNYTKVVVAAGWQTGVEEVAAADGIVLWSFYDILEQLGEKLGNSSVYYDDDTCRTIQLMMKAQKASGGL
jgi:hypothetical protein